MTGCLSDTGGEGGSELGMDAMVGEERDDGRQIPAHPYLARQMSDFGFRQTLEVRTLGCVRRFNPLPARSSLNR